jgi:hypothetical protein
MTLREILNAILDHPIVFEFQYDPWQVFIGILLAVFFILLFACLVTGKFGNDGGWWV